MEGLFSLYYFVLEGFSFSISLVQKVLNQEIGSQHYHDIVEITRSWFGRGITARRLLAVCSLSMAATTRHARFLLVRCHCPGVACRHENNNPKSHSRCTYREVWHKGYDQASKTNWAFVTCAGEPAVCRALQPTSGEPTPVPAMTAAQAGEDLQLPHAALWSCQS